MPKKSTLIQNFSDPDIVSKLQNNICHLAKQIRSAKLMEVCGTHTMSIAKYGLKSLLPQNIKLVSGPGCPVCVTPNSQIDKMIALSKIPNTIICTFGDMMRVPGSESSLLKQKAHGGNIQVVYSPLDALNIAKKNTNKNIIFIAIGFETTAPTTAATIIQAKNDNISNFSVFNAHKNMPGALEYIVNDADVNIDALILPGHVTTITGINVYEFLSTKYNIPGCVSGFEPIDIMQSICMLLRQLVKIKHEHSNANIENAYLRCAKNSGNKVALQLLKEVFETEDTQWRGLGLIKDSAFKIKRKYCNFDAESRFDIKTNKSVVAKNCICKDIIKGVKTPINCPCFAKTCTPINPIGPCMVSTEGACSAYYKYM